MMFKRLYRCVVVSCALALVLCSSAQAEQKAASNRCIFKRFNISALNGVASLPRENLGSRDGGLTKHELVRFFAAANGDGDVSAKKMRKLCNQLAAELIALGDHGIMGAEPDEVITVSATPNDPSFGSL